MTGRGDGSAADAGRAEVFSAASAPAGSGSGSGGDGGGGAGRAVTDADGDSGRPGSAVPCAGGVTSPPPPRYRIMSYKARIYHVFGCCLVDKFIYFMQ
jgi:hypothetical protein